MRIGEMAQRLGISTDVLRAWERRYDLFEPERSTGGYRLYSAEDERIARDLIALRSRGTPIGTAVEQLRARAAAGAHEADGASEEGSAGEAQPLIDDLDQAVRALDQVGATAAVRRATVELGVEGAISAVLLPYLHLLGEQWADGTVSVAHEHFASHTVRRHVGSMAVDLPSVGRRVAVVGCPSNERHDIGSLMVAVVLSRRGWSVRFLGGDTPLTVFDSVASTLRADAVVLSGIRGSVFEAQLPLLRRIADVSILAIGGAGASAEVAAQLGALHLQGDPVAAVSQLDAAIPLRLTHLTPPRRGRSPDLARVTPGRLPPSPTPRSAPARWASAWSARDSSSGGVGGRATGSPAAGGRPAR